MYQVKHTSGESVINDGSVDRTLAQLGVFPISSQSGYSFHLESIGEKAVCDEIIMSSSEPVVMACGGKDVGKSTFLRYMINSLLNKWVIRKKK